MTSTWRMTGRSRLLIAGLCVGAFQLLTLAALVAQEKSLPPMGIEIDDAFLEAHAFIPGRNFV